MAIAMAFKKPGPPEVLEPIEIDDPDPGPGEILIAMRAAGVQPVDTLVRREGYSLGAGDLRYPAVPGNEAAGVVEAVGPDVEGFRPGDEVMGFRVLGAYAERVLLPADQAVAKPAGMPWPQAGGLFASGQTARRNLDTLGIEAGETILIHAAAGGVGTMAVQLARARGAIPIGTASVRNHEYLRSLGAIPVAYGNGLADSVRAVAPGGVDAALDAVGTEEAIATSIELVADRKRIATIVAADRVEELGLARVPPIRSARHLAELGQMWQRGELRIHVSNTYPLRDAAAAHRQVEAGHVRGKVVLTNEKENSR